MRFIPLGVRGSTAAPGAEFVRFGGHTSCVAILADGEEVPHLVLDAGTGIRDLPTLLGDAPFEGSIVLSHLHWDHVQGLPFCRSVDNPDAHVSLHVPVDGEDVDPQALLARALSPPHFPIAPDGLLGKWQFRPLRSGVLDESVQAARVAHKGGIAFGVRVSMDGTVLAYLPDHALHEGTTTSDRERAAGIVAGADVLLHDGQFVAAEDEVARAYGHATIEHVLAFADHCAVGAVVLTHHAPARTDDELDEFAARFARTPQGRPVTFAVQGADVDVHRNVHRSA